nr:aminoglycoside phosphotransferase family protein [Actinopolymorpha rutila]
MRKALDAALPDVRVLTVGRRVEGYANDRWTVESDVGRLLVKVRRIPEEDPRQVEGQLRAQRWLSEIGFPTPELLCVVWKCPQLGGRQLSVQRHVDAVDETGEVLEATPADRRAAYFEGLGRAVGMLHSFELPEFGGWLDDTGTRHDTWAEAIHPGDALRSVSAHPSVVPPDALAEAERRIENGLSALPDIRPRLVHRDLHVDNTLLGPGGGFGAIIDFEMVREWDFPYDFSCRLDGVLDFFAGSKEPFMGAYREVAGELPESFALRNWLYTGIYQILAIEEFIGGNEGYARIPQALLAWLDKRAPV